MILCLEMRIYQLDCCQQSILPLLLIIIQTQQLSYFDIFHLSNHMYKDIIRTYRRDLLIKDKSVDCLFKHTIGDKCLVEGLLLMLRNSWD